MTVEEIEKAIPHRSPMRLLDAVVTREEGRIVCAKTFREDEFFVQGHFPGRPIVPGVILVECCMQAGAVLLRASAEGASPDAVPLATRADNVKFKQVVQPGDRVELEVTLKDQVSNAYFMSGRVLLDGKVAVRLDFACALAEPGD